MKEKIGSRYAALSWFSTAKTIELMANALRGGLPISQ
jgi:hypothetical protein